MKKTTKILIIISIVLIAIGIFAGVSVSTELSSGVGKMEDQYVDGSNFTPLLKLGVTLGAIAVGCVIGFYFALAICGIWIVYGIILLIIKIINKMKERKN